MVAQLIHSQLQKDFYPQTFVGSVKTMAPFVGQHKLLKHKRRFCRESGCNRIVKSQGLCQRHGAKPKKCKIDGCEKQAQGSFDGMCKSHFRSLCSVAYTTSYSAISSVGSCGANDDIMPLPCDGRDSDSMEIVSTFTRDRDNSIREGAESHIRDPYFIHKSEPDHLTSGNPDRFDSWRYVRWNNIIHEVEETFSSNKLDDSLPRPPLARRVFSTDTQFSFDVRSIDEDIDFEHAFDYNISNDTQHPSTISLELL